MTSTLPSHPTLKACVEEAVTTPNPIRGAWLAEVAAKWAAQLETTAGEALRRPPAPAAPVLAANIAVKSEELAHADSALKASLTNVYKAPDQAAQAVDRRMNERGPDATLQLLAAAPESFGAMRGGSFGRQSRDKRNAAILAAKEIPHLLSSKLAAKDAVTQAETALATRRALLADPTYRSQEEAVVALRDVEAAPVAARLPTTPPPSVLSLAAPAQQPSASPLLSYRLVWKAAERLDAVTTSDISRHQAAHDPSTPIEAIKSAQAWHSRSQRLERLERNMPKVHDGVSAQSQYVRGDHLSAQMSEAMKNANAHGDPLAAAHAVGIKERADHCTTMAAQMILEAIKNDPDFRRNSFQTNLLPEIHAAAARATAHNQDQPKTQLPDM